MLDLLAVICLPPKSSICKNMIISFNIFCEFFYLFRVVLILTIAHSVNYKLTSKYCCHTGLGFFIYHFRYFSPTNSHKKTRLQSTF